MANNTCDAVKEPEVQAEPLEAAIPSISKLSNIDSPSINSKQKLAFPGSLFTG